MAFDPLRVFGPLGPERFEQRRDLLAQQYEFVPEEGALDASLSVGAEPDGEELGYETYVGALTISHLSFLERTISWDHVVFQESEFAIEDMTGHGDAVAYLESGIDVVVNEYLNLLLSYGVTILADVRPITYFHNQTALDTLESARVDSIWATRPQFCVPPRAYWPNIVAPLLALQKVLERESYVQACSDNGVDPRNTVALYNGYRPTPYNTAAGGRPGSRHRFNHAIDIAVLREFRSSTADDADGNPLRPLAEDFWQAVDDFFDHDPMVATHFMGIVNYSSGSRHFDGRLPDDQIRDGYPLQRSTHGRRGPWQGGG